MEIKLLQSSESDGDWYKVFAGDKCKACICIRTGEEDKALQSAFRIFNFYVENKGYDKLIKSETV